MKSYNKFLLCVLYTAENDNLQAEITRLKKSVTDGRDQVSHVERA